MPVSQRKTPGVYVTEQDAFPPSVVGVQTAVPLFIGYTETAECEGKSVFFEPQKLSGLADYTRVFGGAPSPRFKMGPGTQTDHDASFQDAAGSTRYLNLQRIGTPLILPDAMRLFYKNGGAECYVVSVGDFNAAEDRVDRKTLQKGLDAAALATGPTMLVLPDAVLLNSPQDFAKLVQAMLDQCGTLQDRFAILDVYGTETLTPESATLPQDVETLIDDFRALLGENALSYGASYFPFLNTNLYTPDDLDYRVFNPPALQEGLLQQAKALYSGDDLASVTALIKQIADTKLPDKEIAHLDAQLVTALPLLQELLNAVATILNIQPPSAALAGVYTEVDNTRGVWNAPANVSLVDVTSPTVPINDEMQEDMNVPLDGKSVAALRAFTGRGTVVWGARTLDGNSNDWRYIQVRRTIIYIEQSIKSALDPFVFSANDGQTWVTVTAMVSNFLQQVWSQGGLFGSTASEAFSVECGLGSTMTAQDIIEGYMIVQVRLQLIRPAEFIELTFKQQMQSA